jgi:predicted alpha/beta hydrolase
MKETISVITRDGVRISATWFIADHSQEKIVLINSATGVKQSYYSDFACFLAKQGFNVYTYDYRGIGASRHSDIAYAYGDMKDWSTDVDAMISHVTGVHPQAKLIIIGHSVGGQLIGMSKLAGYADAFLMVGAQTPYWKNFDGIGQRIKLIFFWYFLIPVLTKIFGYFPSSKLKLFEDLPFHVARQWARWARSPRFAFDEHPSLRTSFECLDQRSLFISVADDNLAPQKAVLELKQHYKNLRAEHWHIHPEDILQEKIGHFGFFRKQMEIALWNDTVRWIQSVTPVQKYKTAS